MKTNRTLCRGPVRGIGPISLGAWEELQAQKYFDKYSTTIAMHMYKKSKPIREDWNEHLKTRKWNLSIPDWVQL